jgi:hypothetical protein
MRTNATNTFTPRAMFQTGVVLSATTARGHDLPRTVRIGQEDRAFEALAFNAPWLDLALEGPLAAWTLQLAHADEGARLPILLGLEEDPFSDGLTHLPDIICPVTDVVLRIKALIAGINTAPLHAFVRNVFQRRDISNSFWIMPASGRDHHSYPGGLAVHSQEVADDLSGHFGLSDLELDLGIAGAILHDIGAYVMRCLLSGNSRMRENGSHPSSLLQRIKACDQRSCERDRAASGSRRSSRPVWTPRAWDDCSPANFQA